MIGITTGGILNIFLDPIFIFGLGLGTSGAALATALSQIISFCILFFMCNTKKECITILPQNFRPTINIYQNIIYGGIPSLGRQGIASVATIIMNIMAHPYGDAAIAATVSYTHLPPSMLPDTDRIPLLSHNLLPAVHS